MSDDFNRLMMKCLVVGFIVIAVAILALVFLLGRWAR